jgi:hypothetical protein
MRRLCREEYADFTVKRFHEELRRRHGYLLGYTVTRLALQSAGLVTPARRRCKHRRKRQRRPMPGMLLFQILPITPKAGGKVDKGHLTQVGRALA